MKVLRVAWIGAFLLAGCDTGEQSRIVGQLASERLEITAEFAEPIVTRHVQEGDAVAAGAPLVTQQTARVDARLREAEAAVAGARARLDELVRGPRRERIEAARADVAGARREVEFRRSDHARVSRLLDQDLVSEETVDRAKATLDTASATLAALEARLGELLAGTTVEELRQAEAELARAEAAVESLALDRERLVLAAPVAGIVDALPFEEGERPPAGAAVAVLLAGDQPHARIYVPEALRVRVAPGTAARVHVDGLPEVVPGRVRWVSSDAAFTPYFALTEHDRGRLAYVAEVGLDYAGRRLPDGVPVEVELDLPESAP